MNPGTGPGPVADGCVLRVVHGADPVMRDVATLCYEALHKPFGVERDDEWDNLDPDSTHIVASDDSGVVGYVRLIREEGWAHLRQLCVREDRRRRGIGTALVREAVSRARAAGMDRIYLNARLTAVPLYQREGFAVVGHAVPMPRTFLPHVRMERTPGGPGMRTTPPQPPSC